MSSILSKLINLAGNITGTLGVGNGGTGVTTSTGSGSVVLNTSPSLVTPVLGTPTSGNLSNCTSYPNVTQATAGLVASAGQLLGINTTTAASAGNVGEIIRGVLSSASGVSVANATAVGLCTVTLTPGDWDLQGIWNFQCQNTTVVTQLIGAISLTNNSLGGGDYGVQNASGEIQIPWSAGTSTYGAANNQGPCLSAWTTVSVSTNTIYYLVAYTLHTTNNVFANGSLVARRVR